MFKISWMRRVQMIGYENPWRDMNNSSQRRAVAESPHNLFWILDHYGNYGFLIVTDKQGINSENNLSLKGITIHKRSVNTDINEFFLVLNSRQDWDLFYALCRNLIQVILQHTNQKKMILAVEKRLKRWQQLLKQQRNPFTIEKQMGLFSELQCLKEVVMTISETVNDAIISWVGPDFDKQDFLLSKAVIEVKSYRTSKGEAASISSAQQLYSEKEPFYLFSYALTTTDSGLSVADVSKEVRQVILSYSVQSLELFDEKLMQYGYIPELIHEPLQRFTIDKLKVFNIQTGFPRIVPTDIPSQISLVKYSIDLSQCGEFEVDINDIVRRD